MAITNLSINDIFVNPDNPRHNPALDDITAINVLINENVDEMMELVNSINEFGFFPQKVVSLVEKNGKHVAIDGNRRIAAIKCALNPNIISNKKFKNKIAQIALKQISDKMTIPCVKYGNIKEAVPFILAEHTEGGQTKKWTRIQQCYFMLNYGTRADVPEIFLLYYDNFTRDYNSSIENFSTIERIIKKEQHELLSKLDTDTLKKVLMQFVQDTNSGGGETSRSLNKSEDQIKYFNDVYLKYTGTNKQSEQVENKTSSSFNDNIRDESTLNDKRQDLSDPIKSKMPLNVKPKSISHAFKMLKWSGLDPNNLWTKSIIEVAKEVKSLAKYYDKFPISTTILIRTLLELSLKYWLSIKHSSKYKILINNAKGKDKDPQLSDIIAEIKKQIQNNNIIFDMHIDNLFNMYFSTKDTTMKDRMDILVHRPWDLGTNAQTYKIHEEDVIYQVIDFILNTK